jgi:hypothetical protein
MATERLNGGDVVVVVDRMGGRGNNAFRRTTPSFVSFFASLSGVSTTRYSAESYSIALHRKSKDKRFSLLAPPRPGAYIFVLTLLRVRTIQRRGVSRQRDCFAPTNRQLISEKKTIR